MFRKLLPFSLILLIVISMFAVLYSPVTAAAPRRTPKPTRTPLATKTKTPTPAPSGSWIMVTSPNGGEVLTNGEEYSITWVSSADIEFVDIMLGYRSLCEEDCIPYWSTELSTGPMENTGSFTWATYIEDPADKQFFIMISGGSADEISFHNSIVLAMDVSDRPFAIIENPFATPTATDEPLPTLTETAIPTFTLTASATPNATFTRTPTLTWTPDNPD